MQEHRSESKTKVYKAAVYARKSNDDRKGGEKSNSVNEQILSCLSLIQKEGWELDKDGLNEAYIEDGVTGRAWPKGDHYKPQSDSDDLTKEVIKNHPESKRTRPAFG